MRRWMIYGFAASAVLSAAGGVSYALYANHVTLADIVRTAEADANALMIAAGFGIDQVNISGQHFASDNDIYDALDLTNVKTFAAFDSEAVLKRIERIPWIDKVQMTRVYPGTLDIVVRERTPALIWTRGNENYLVDATGRVLGPTPTANNWTLPRVVGEGAKDDANLLLAVVRRYPAIQSQFAYGQRIGERRWRIVLKNGTMLDLAADRETEGLQEITSAPAVVPALKGTAMVVDVRTPGRITMRPIDNTLAMSTGPGKSSGAPLTISSR
jgi:cell division protein FtsQ